MNMTSSDLSIKLVHTFDHNDSFEPQQLVITCREIHDQAIQKHEEYKEKSGGKAVFQPLVCEYRRGTCRALRLY